MKEKDHRLGDYFKRYRKQIMWSIYLKTHDYHMAEDICQDTFVRLSRNLNRVPPEKVGKWLFLVSEHVRIDYLRKGGKYKTILQEEFSEELACDVESDPGNILVRREQREERDRVLERLAKEKPLWYEALMLHYMENMKDREIGKLLGVKASLIGKWRERTLKWLRNAYEEEDRKGTDRED